MVYGVFFVMVVAGTRQWIIKARTQRENSAMPDAIPTAVPAEATKEAVNAMTSIDEHSETHARGSAGEIVLDSIEYAVEQLAAGRPVVVVDDEDRENEGDLIFAASLATPEVLAFTIRYSSGVVCVPMPGEELDRLDLPPMTAVNQDRKGTAYAVSVDARDGVDHRHLGRRPGAHHPAAGRPGDRCRRPDPARPRLPAAGAARRRAGAAPATPRPPWTCAAWRACRRPAASAEIVNDDGTHGAAARSSRCSPRSTAWR